MVEISDCPDSGMKRKVKKNLQKLETVGQVILECEICYFNSVTGQEVRNRGIQGFTHKLTAHNGIYVNPFTVANPGKKWSKEESEAYDKAIADHTAWENEDPETRGEEPERPSVHPMGQFDFFMALTHMPIKMHELEMAEIAEADAAGKFNG